LIPRPYILQQVPFQDGVNQGERLKGARLKNNYYNDRLGSIGKKRKIQSLACLLGGV
jgi:hypothetical protein